MMSSEREAIFWERVREGMSATAACESIGVNRKPGYRWITGVHPIYLLLE
jgi:transposase